MNASALVWQAAKSWKNSAGVALLVVIAFTVGIGSSTAIFNVVNTLLLKQVPYQHGERFVSVLGGDRKDPASMSALTIEHALEYQRMRSFDLFGWFKFDNVNLTSPGQPLYLNGVRVTPALANGLGVNPQIGRWFRDADERSAV